MSSDSEKDLEETEEESSESTCIACNASPADSLQGSLLLCSKCRDLSNARGISRIEPEEGSEGTLE
jgi:hypothetical protein